MIPISEEFPIGKLMEHFQSRRDVHDVFGVILYTEADPYIIKVLRDNDFWSALHVVSGPRWPIFSIRPERRQSTLSVRPGRPGALQSLIPIHEWHEPTENRRLLTAFGLNDTSELPLLMIFAKGTRDDVLQVAFHISGDDPDACYTSLRGAVEVAARAVEDVRDENVKNTFEVFRLMKGAIQQHIWFHRIKRGVNFAEWVKSVGSLFGG